MKPENPIKPEEGENKREKSNHAQLQGHYWDELRKLKRVKIITDGKFSGIIFSQNNNDVDAK